MHTTSVQLHKMAAVSDRSNIRRALSTGEPDLSTELAGHSLHFSSLDKTLWPGVTKRDLLLYYEAVSEPMIAHLKGRPVTLIRMPNGLKGPRFLQRHQEGKLPEFVQTMSIYTEDRRGPERYLLIDDLATLLWLGQMNTMEIHAWYSRIDPGPEKLKTTFSESEASVEASALEYPDYMVFDLDPSVPGGKRLTKTAFGRVRKAALILRVELDAYGLKAWLKTSGKSGLHALVPIHRRYPYDQVRAFAETLARKIAANHPKLATIERGIEDRGERVYFDYSQNARGKSLAAVYSPRAAPEAPVSFPVDWSDIDTVYPTDFTIHNVPGMLAKKDPWSKILENRQELPTG